MKVDMAVPNTCSTPFVSGALAPALAAMAVVEGFTMAGAADLGIWLTKPFAEPARARSPRVAAALGVGEDGGLVDWYIDG